MSHANPAPLVSIIIPVFNKWDYTFKCLMAVANHTRDVEHEVIVVDNASSDDTKRALPQLDGIRLLRNEQNLGFAKASNQGAAMARGKYLMFLNNDTEPRARWLSVMVEILDAEPRVAMVGSKLLFPDGTIQHGGVVFAYGGPLPVTPFHLHYRHPAAISQERLSLRAVTAACMLIRAQVFRTVGPFDEGFVNGYEDVDLCLKVAETGAKIIYAPDSVVVHHESVSEGRFNADSSNVDRLNQRWQGRFQAFDVDFRREVTPLAVDPRRPGASVILPMRDAIWSIAPCLENLRHTTGDQDEVIVVDDGSIGPTRDFVQQFAARFPGRFRVLRNEAPTSLSQAARQGLEAATRARAVIMAPSLRVVSDWLARLSAHLDARPQLGAVVPTVMPVERLPMHNLLYPLELCTPAAIPAGSPPPPPLASHPQPASPGDVEEITYPPARMFYGARDRLLEISRRVPEALLGHDQARMANELRAQGLALGRARDVGVYRLTQIPGDADAEALQRYTAQSSANLVYEDAYHARAQGQGQEADGAGAGAIVGRVTSAQTELTSVVIVARDNLAITTECLASIYAHTQRSFEVVLVDNGSTEDLGGLVARLRARHGNITWLRNAHDVGYAQACNQGLTAARGEYLAILHNDVVVTPGWLARQLAVMALHPAVGLTGPALSSGNGPQSVSMKNYRSLDDLPLFAESWAVNHAGECAVTMPLSGACLLMKRQVVSRVGGLDSAFGSAIHTDDDLCVRAYRAGYRLAVAYDAFVYHRGAATWKALGLDRASAAEEAWRVFCRKWAVAAGAKLAAAVREASAQRFDPERDRIPLTGGQPAVTDGLGVTAAVTAAVAAAPIG